MDETVRVLHVDDDPEFGDLVATHLERRDGFEVVVESDPADALDRIRRPDPASGDDPASQRGRDGPAVDCVVSDYEMGSTTGLDLLRRIRAVDERLPFVLFTSRGSEEVASEAISAGVTDYIQKQLRTEQYELLANRIRNAVDHYRTERALRESEQLYRTAVERSHDAIYIYQDDSFLFVNQRACELTGYAESELKERNIWSLIHPEDRDRVREIAEQRAREDPETPSRYRARILRKDGGVRRCNFSVQPITYGGERAVLGSVHEMSGEERAEERFQALIEHSSDLITVLDEDRTIRYESPSIERILGWETTTAVGRDVLETVHPDDRARVREVFDRLAAAEPGETESAIFRTRHADGSWVWLEAVGRADPVESVDGFVINSRDVTERREREQRLRRYESIVSNIQQGAYVIGADYRFEYVNPAVRAQTGLPEGSFVGRSLDVLAERGYVDEAELTGLRAAIDRILDGEVTDERAELEVTLDDETLVVEVGLSALRERAFEDADETGAPADSVVAVSTDVTARKRYEERLGALHTASRRLTRATTHEEVAEIVSEAAADILNYPLNGVHFYDPDRDALVPTVLTDAVADVLGDPVAIPRDGGVAWQVFEEGEPKTFADVSTEPDALNPETDLRSEVILPIGDRGVLIAGSTERGDLDDSRVSLAQVLVSNARAALERVDREQLLRRRERERAHQNEQLEQVANVVSHDLRNPLTLASGQLQLLAELCESGADENADEVAERIGTIEDAHERMRRIIADMLDLARHGQPVDDLETVPLRSVVSRAWDVATSDADATIEVASDLGTVRAHEGRLTQLFENLFRNAVEHAGHDVGVTVGLLDDGAGFYVVDDGPGIDEKDREAVFEPGFSTADDGTGLGLGIVRTVAHAHGWSVSLADSDGGARFEVRLDPSGRPERRDASADAG
jgi:PAS domain S-box-containing protein